MKNLNTISDLFHLRALELRSVRMVGLLVEAPRAQDFLFVSDTIPGDGWWLRACPCNATLFGGQSAAWAFNSEVRSKLSDEFYNSPEKSIFWRIKEIIDTRKTTN